MPREEVIKYAEAMEVELKENDHKGYWRDQCDLEFLADKLDEEVQELKHAMGCYEREDCKLKPNKETLEEIRKSVLSEAADVGNIAMMIADICEALPEVGK